MHVIRELFDNEAALAVAVIEAVLIVAVAFGATLDPAQVAALVGLMLPVGAVVTRSLVTSKDTVRSVRARSYAEGVADTAPYLGPDGPDDADDVA